MNLEMSSEHNEFDKDYFIEKIKESNGQIKFMSQTIDDFRDFYKVQKQKQVFELYNACKLAINITKPALKKKNIDIELDIEKELKIKGYENEFAQVILNFLSNSMEAFETRKIKAPRITINVQCKKNKVITCVCDNARGIKEEHLNRVFEPHFSTKKRGSGIGLYMSDVIIQSHFDGSLRVYNTKEGACFEITI
jgi:signal transduction histidine kinase